ncbi:DUF2057 family protein [Aeromonas encheleia]|uniref:YccT family protein n=1 Tax=Aeromonas encheleia TaxID=73010 RepID=UPI003BF58E3C
MKLTVLVPALAGLLWAGSALASSQLEISNPYVVQLLDGVTINPKLLDKTSSFPIGAGKHQLVVAFEGNYSNRNDIKLVTAEPLVINFTAADNQTLMLDYKKPRTEEEAKQFVKEQKVVLKDKSSGQALTSEQFVMPTVGGFQLTRDYQQETAQDGQGLQPANRRCRLQRRRDGCRQRPGRSRTEQGPEQSGSPDPAAKLVQQGRCGNPQSLPDLGDPAAVMASSCQQTRGARLPFFISAPA